MAWWAIVKAAAKSVVKEVTKGVTKEAAKGVATEAAKGVAKEAAKGVAKEAAKGAIKEVAKSAVTETAKGVVKDTATNVVKEGATEAGKSALQEVATNTAKDGAQTALQDTAKSGVQDAAQNVIGGQGQGAGQGSVQDQAIGQVQNHTDGAGGETGDNFGNTGAGRGKESGEYEAETMANLPTTMGTQEKPLRVTSAESVAPESQTNNAAPVDTARNVSTEQQPVEFTEAPKETKKGSWWGTVKKNIATVGKDYATGGMEGVGFTGDQVKKVVGANEGSTKWTKQTAAMLAKDEPHKPPEPAKAENTAANMPMGQDSGLPVQQNQRRQVSQNAPVQTGGYSSGQGLGLRPIQERSSRPRSFRTF